MQLIPAIDLIDGRCVRLSKGDYNEKKVYDAEPLDWALQLQDCGVERLHVVDLDGAKASEPQNLRVLEHIHHGNRSEAQVRCLLHSKA